MNQSLKKPSTMKSTPLPMKHTLRHEAMESVNSIPVRVSAETATADTSLKPASTFNESIFLIVVGF